MSMSKFATKKDYVEARVQKKWPAAYQYNAGPGVWRINVQHGDTVQTIGVGRTAYAAWQNAEKRCYDIK